MQKCSKLPETAIFGSDLDESVFFEYGSSERKFFIYILQSKLIHRCGEGLEIHILFIWSFFS